MGRGTAARKRRSARRARVVQPGVSKARAQGTEAAVDALVADVMGSTLESPLLAAASGKTGLPLGDRTEAWDKAAAVATLDPAQYGDASFWTDPDGDTATKAAHKLWFAKDDGGLRAVWKGVTAAAGAVQGARGGVSIPASDVAGVRSRIAGYYAAAAKKYDDDGITPPWKAADKASVQYGTERGLDVLYASDGEPTNEQGRYIGMGGDFNPVELVAVQRTAAAEALAYAEAGDDPFALAVLTAAWEQALAPMPTCAGCDHAYADHLGTDGPCSIDGCSCDGYETEVEPDEPDDDTDDELELANGEVAGIRFRLELDEQAVVAALVEHSRLVPADAAAASDAAAAVMDRFQDGFAGFLRSFEAAEQLLPAEHQPGERTPDQRPGPVVQGDPDVEYGWTAIFAPEGRETADRRAFAPGSIRWRTPPLTLMAMTETSIGGHVGAEVAGRIDRIWRDDAAMLIRAGGDFDRGAYGSEIERLVDERTLRGVSVDLAIHKYESGPRSDYFDEAGNWAPKPEDERSTSTLLDLMFGGDGDPDDPIISVVTDAEIGMTTVCPFPAFAEAEIAVGNSLVAAGAPDSIWTVTMPAQWALVARPKALTAAAPADPFLEDIVDAMTKPLTASAAGLAPERPPAAWFEAPDPDADPPGSIVVGDDGRVSGYAALWDTCHLGFPGQCVIPPESASGYAYFHLGEVECDDGTRIHCGQITLDTGHAPPDLGRAAATAHYDDTGTAAADVVVGENEHGIWVAGALRADVDAEKARTLRGAKLSGDWRGVNGNRELVALLAVNVPGFPVPRPRALVAVGLSGEEELVSLTAAGIPVEEAELTPDQLERFRALRAHAEFAALAEQAA